MRVLLEKNEGKRSVLRYIGGWLYRDSTVYLVTANLIGKFFNE